MRRPSWRGAWWALSLSCLVARPAQADVQRPKLHLGCPQTCFEDYLRQELSYFDIVRDREQSDFALLIVRQKAANGGERITLQLSRADGSEVPRVVSTPPAAQAEQVREQLRNEVVAMLYDPLSTGPHRTAFRMTLPRRVDGSLSSLVDPWDHWVMSPELKGFVDTESNFQFVELHGALTLRRITEHHRLRFRGGYVQRINRFVVEDGSEVIGNVSAWSGRMTYARAVGRRFALGFAATESASEVENLRGHAHGGAVAEVNLFPYSENVNQQVRFAYQAGPWFNWYLDTTRSGLLHEVRPYHALTAVADANQPWGSVQWALQFNSLIDEPGKWRLGSAAVASLRVFEGFAVVLQGRAALVRDQLGLRARPLTDNEILLGNVEQKTNHQIQLEFGVSYTFGSVHDTIVNPRFGRLDLEEE